MHITDPDFQETTRLILSDISAARGHPVPDTPVAPQPSFSETPTTSTGIAYPFNLVLTTATVPVALDFYLGKNHPQITRLVSPNLHHFPTTLSTEYVDWSGGNKLADIEKRVRKVWSEDYVNGSIIGGDAANHLSKVLIFCNKSTKVEMLGAYLEEKGIKNVALTSKSDIRKRGSNKHLDGFLKELTWREESAETADEADEATASQDETATPVAPSQRTMKAITAGRTPEVPTASNPKEQPHVMITTSLLSRGLDFSPDIRHVFIVDEPRNIVDFLHRAGRAARAGEKGKVVIFGKTSGRGSDRTREVQKKVAALAA